MKRIIPLQLTALAALGAALWLLPAPAPSQKPEDESDEYFKSGKVLQLSLSFDHRVVDGQQGSQFLADVGALLADPGLAIAF